MIQLMNIFHSKKDEYTQSNLKSSILDIRAMICDKLIMAFAILSIPAIISSISRVSVIGWKPLMAVHAILLVLLWFIFLRSKYISYKSKAIFIIIIFLVIGFGGLSQLGLVSAGLVFIITSPPLAVLFFDERAGLSVLIVSLIGIIIIGFLTVAGYLSPGFDLETFHASNSAWITVLFGTLLVSGSLTAAMSVFNKNLINALAVSQVREAELKKHKAELEDIIKEKTKEIIQSNQALEQFAKIAAHDMVSPLQAISGNAQMIQLNCADKLDEDTSESLIQIIESAHYMSSIINDQLNLSKVLQDKISVSYIDINNVLDKVINELQSEINNSSTLVTHDTLPAVYINETQLKRIFQNIISNAIKYRHENRQLTIHISAKEEDEFWVFSITDNGIGIEPSEIGNIFKIFHQVNKEETAEGVGIGLSSCKNIIESHGGKIWVESELGAGSVFYFTLKYTDDEMNVI